MIMRFKDNTKEFQASMPSFKEFIDKHMVEYKCSRPVAAGMYASYMSKDFKVYTNSEYTVAVFPATDDGVVRMSIQNKDKSAKRDWRAFQDIKNSLIGAENEGVELYPAESRKNDVGNAFHMFVLADPSARFRLGSPHRRVSNTPPKGYDQRPLPTYDPESGEV